VKALRIMGDGRRGEGADGVARTVLLALGALVALAAVYGSAYLALVNVPGSSGRPTVVTFALSPQTSPDAVVVRLPERNNAAILDIEIPSYRVGGVLARRIFGLAFAIDRRLRPARWRLDLLQPSLVPLPPASSGG
jgi:hypothetical protein